MTVANGSSKIVRSTPGLDVNTLGEIGINTSLPRKIEPSYILKGQNPLNKYRSLTYNFTLAALPGDYLTNPEAYRTGELDLVVLKSGGKGFTGIKAKGASAADVAAANTEVYAADDAGIKREALVNIAKQNMNFNLAAGFNEKSPGRFDMFIENIEIETIMAFRDGTNVTQPSVIKFDVIEPYSVNGFIEALQVAAVSAGYSSYMESIFVLKVEFWGYPDDQDVANSAPVKAEGYDRFIPMLFSTVEVDITEKGTRYRCEAVPSNEKSFGQDNKLKQPIKMTGLTVKEILTDFMEKVTRQNTKINEEGKISAAKDHYDTYEIVFPSVNENGYDYSADNSIASSDLIEIFRDNALYKMVDPSTVSPVNAYKTGESPGPQKRQSRPDSFKYNPEKTAIQFPENANIHEIISSVIRDSEYVRNILEALTKEKKSENIPDDNGLVNYFLIKIETTFKQTRDVAAKRNYQIIKYIVTPYKIHYTRIPLYNGSVQIPESQIKPLAVREYNYIYTGKNLDVIDFKLKFDTLFFEALPAALGNKPMPAAQISAAPDGSKEVKVNEPKIQEKLKTESEIPPHPNKQTAVPVRQNHENAGQYLNDPFSTMARGMHDAIVNSRGSMLDGEIQILGDPMYLVTGGMGNYRPKLNTSNSTVTENQEAAFTYGDVLIAINFRNPIDIRGLAAGGLMYFNDEERVPFSGIYRVLTVKSTFKDGKFIQFLTMIRMPGQLLDGREQTILPFEVTQSLVNREDQPTSSPTGSAGPEYRLPDSNPLSIGYPSPGLPGQLSNFTNATGGLGGSYDSILNQTYGFDSGFGGNLFSQSSFIGAPLPSSDQISSNIRLDSAGLASLNRGSLQSAALVNAAADVFPGDYSAQDFANSMVDSLQTNSVDLTANAFNAVSNLGREASQLVNDIGGKINQSVASVADPKSIAAAAGLDPSRLSGLSNNLTSRLPRRIQGLLSGVPTNLNLDSALASGRSVDFSNISNFPPTAPYTNVSNNIYSIGAATSRISASGNPIDSVVSSDKIASVKSMVSGLYSTSRISDQIMPGTITSRYGSRSLATNPLDKLMKRG
jgi:hypothetical protein